MAEAEKYLQINDLAVHYTSGKSVVRAVNGVSLSVERGKTLGLVGETGAGKTTIAKSILRILPDPPAKIDRGEILVEGQDILKKNNQEMLDIRGKKIAMIFQDPMTALNPVMSIGNQIREAIYIHSDRTRKEALDRAVEMLEMVGIPGERYVEYPYQFSGGMKQRAVIAMALACSPELLLADEPTSALDVTIQAQVLEMIMALQEKFNTAMILITHDLGVVAETCSDVAVIYAGQIMEYGSKRDIFKHASHPYTRGLFASIPKIGDNDRGKKRLHPMPGMTVDPTRLPEGCLFCPRCPWATQECKASRPPMAELTPGHFCRCIKPGGGRRDVGSD